MLLPTLTKGTRAAGFEVHLFTVASSGVNKKYCYHFFFWRLFVHMKHGIAAEKKYWYFAGDNNFLSVWKEVNTLKVCSQKQLLLCKASASNFLF